MATEITALSELRSPPLKPLVKAIILLIDDDTFVLKALEQTISREGHKVLTATNGLDAIALLNEYPVAVIISDQRMEGMTGIEVLQEAQKIRPDAIRILLTGNSDMDTVTRAINIGHVSQFIVKPWDSVQLMQTVSTSLHQYRLSRENRELQETILAQHATLERSHATLQRDLELGGRIHEELLTGKVPSDYPHLMIAAQTIPSKEIDGDFYEFYLPTSDTLDLVIADVMGKGIPAALVGTAVKTQMMRFALPFLHAKVFGKEGFWQDDLMNPVSILQQVHQGLVSKLIHLEYFVSLFYARFNLTKQTVCFSDCGFTKPVHYRSKDKQATFLSGRGFPLGMVEEEAYHSTEIPYQPGDIFIFYSDGVTEARSPAKEFFGSAPLLEIAEKYGSTNVEELIQIIQSSVINFAGKDTFDDDLTIIVIKIPESCQLSPRKVKTGLFRSDLSQLKALMDFIQRACAKGSGDTNRLTNEMQLIGDEVFINIIKHAYQGDKSRTIRIQCEYESRGLTLLFSDQGIAFDPAEVEEPNLTGEDDHGFGWYIIKEIADNLTYITKTHENGWNHLRIFKRYHFKEESMEIMHTTENGVLVITPQTESLDANDAREFKEKVIELIASNDKQKVVFDLQFLQFIDSSGLGTLLSVLRILHSKGGELKLARMSKPIRTMFELVSMHKIFEIFNSTEEAVRSFDDNKQTAGKTKS
jgi:anti-anti-sigma factor